jgi:hypothetical protein
MIRGGGGFVNPPRDDDFSLGASCFRYVPEGDELSVNLLFYDSERVEIDPARDRS